MSGRVAAAVRWVVAGAIRLWQLTASRILPPSCRFRPSCSEYARLAVLHHGVVIGGWLALKRLLRCHPWSRGGYDPVPGVPAEEQGIASGAISGDTGPSPSGE